MTDENNDDGTIRDELNTIMPGSDPLQNLDVEQTGPVHYSVLSARNGTVTVHRVDIQNIECSCADMTYNTGATSTDNEGREVCAHIVAAMLAHPQLDVDGMAFYDALGLTQRSHRMLDDLQSERDEVERTLVSLRDAQGGQSASDASQTVQESAETSPPPGNDVDPDDAADRLQDAFDDVVEDMRVMSEGGWVWVQTGPDTPDALSGPGNVSPFEAFLQNPDAVEYIHDEHDDVSQKPGEWWKNRIAPEAVDDYVSEVLE